MLPERTSSSINSKAFSLGIKGKLGVEPKIINTNLNESMGYVIGVIYGDGSLRYYKEKDGSEHFCVTLSVKDKDFRDNFVKVIENLESFKVCFCIEDGILKATRCL